MRTITTLLGGLLGVLIIALALIYGSLVSGLVIYKFWYWFATPVFTTLPNITFGMAVGLSWFVTIFKTVNHKEETPEGKKFFKYNWGAALLYPWMVLLFGYLVHLVIS